MNVYLHPFTAHFPLALLLVGSLIELWATRPDRATWQTTARHMLLLGWWAALLTSLTGIVDLALRWERIGLFLSWINSHALSGLLLVIVYWRVVLGRPLPPTARRRWLIAGISLLLLAGWLGGQLVYSLGWTGGNRK